MVQQTPQTNELREAVAASRRIFVGLAVFSLFTSLLMLTGPLYMLQVYDNVLSSNSVPTLVALTLLVAGLYATLGFLSWIRASLFSDAGSKFEALLSTRAIEASVRANLSDSGQQTDRPLRDLRVLRRFFASPALAVVFDAPLAPMFFAVLFILHWSFGLWAVFGTIILVVIALINQRGSRVLLDKAEGLERQATHQATEITRNVEVMEAMGMRRPLEARWQKLFDESDGAMTTANRRISGFTEGTKAFRLFLQSAILGLGAYLAIIQVSTPGAMIAASILMGRAIAPIEQFVGQWRVVVQARDSWTSLQTALEKAPAKEAGMKLPPITGQVSMENVFAAPPGISAPTLLGLSFELNAGDVLGVIGPSAAGKSSLARVLTGIWPAGRGVVRIDGADLTSYPREEIGPQIGYLPQQVDLFAGTVRENICRFDAEAEPDAIIAAAQAAGCHDLILHLQDGYDSQIGASGAYLSAGQRQRVGLARALYGDPSLIILDEPNSNLDAPGEKALQDAILRAKSRGATVVIIAHRPNAIVHCNKLMMLDGGEIREFGPRDEILQKLAANSKGRVTPIRKGEATT